MFVRRDYLKKKVLKTQNDDDDDRNVCYYCKYGDKCEKFYAIRNELKKKGFNGFNKNVPVWNVYKDRFHIEPLPLDLRM